MPNLSNFVIYFVELCDYIANLPDKVDFFFHL